VRRIATSVVRIEVGRVAALAGPELLRETNADALG
jgi:hypothetical protein